MIINSDERQWTWMDEGLNTFVQTLTQEAFDNNYPTDRGNPSRIADYMRLPKDQLEPIMTNSENLVQFGSNAYAKTAAGLNILRETILGRELFDYAFKEYARRWAFHHPTPADFLEQWKTLPVPIWIGIGAPGFTISNRLIYQLIRFMSN